MFWFSTDQNEKYTFYKIIKNWKTFENDSNLYNIGLLYNVFNLESIALPQQVISMWH